MGSSSKVPVITIEYFTFAHEVKPTTFLSFFFRHVCLYGMSGYLYIYLYVSVYIVHTWVCAHSPSTLNVRVHERERSTPPPVYNDACNPWLQKIHMFEYPYWFLYIPGMCPVVEILTCICTWIPQCPHIWSVSIYVYINATIYIYPVWVDGPQCI